MPAGRPRYYNSSEELDAQVDAYFREKNCKNEPYTMSGLALYLGFSDKKMLYEYEARPEFSHSIKLARARIEEQIDLETRRSKTPPAVGIFMLKNFGWRDDQNIRHEVEPETIKEFQLFKLNNANNQNIESAPCSTAGISASGAQ